MIRTILMLGFWIVAVPVIAIIFFPWVLITGDILPLYRAGIWGAWIGIRIAGVKVQTVGRERLDPKRTYVFLSNHASMLDPPLLLPLIPGRTSVIAKRELFNYPILGKAMRMASLVPVDRGNRDAGITAVRAAADVVKQGIHMTIFVEGSRSFDGKLLPFKKGPFYLAEECRAPVVPVTISGTHAAMPKQKLSIQPGLVTVTFHQPIEPSEFGTRGSDGKSASRNQQWPARRVHVAAGVHARHPGVSSRAQQNGSLKRTILKSEACPEGGRQRESSGDLLFA